MENLELKRKHLQDNIACLKDELEFCKQELELLKDCTEVDTKELYHGIEKYCDIKINKDNRRKPNEDLRILELKPKAGIYLTSRQMEVVESYVDVAYDFDFFEWVK